MASDVAVKAVPVRVARLPGLEPRLLAVRGEKPVAVILQQNLGIEVHRLLERAVQQGDVAYGEFIGIYPVLGRGEAHSIRAVKNGGQIFKGVVLVIRKAGPNHEPGISVHSLKVLGRRQAAEFAERDEFAAKFDKLVVVALLPVAVVHVCRQHVDIFIAGIIEVIRASRVAGYLPGGVCIPYPQEVVEVMMVHHPVPHHTVELLEAVLTFSPSPPEPLSVHLVIRSPDNGNAGLLERQEEVDRNRIDLRQPLPVHLAALRHQLLPLLVREVALRLLAEIHDTLVERTVDVPHKGDDMAAGIVLLRQFHDLRSVPGHVSAPYLGLDPTGFGYAVQVTVISAAELVVVKSGDDLAFIHTAVKAVQQFTRLGGRIRIHGLGVAVL